MKKMVIVLSLTGIAFGVTLAVLIGTRLSAEALSVVAGAACGVGALLPLVAVLAGLLLRRNDNLNSERQARASYPPVIVVAPPAALPPGQTWASGPHAQPVSYNAAGYANITRQFSIIGNDGEEITDDEHRNNW
jgi:hypothetical protein